MSTNLEYRAREEREKETVGGRPAKLKEKKGDRDLERDKKNKGDFFFSGVACLRRLALQDFIFCLNKLYEHSRELRF